MLNKLTGMPTEHDTILTALPMCAPYSMMINHKYKCKLQPGTLKRGKAKKIARDLFVSLSKNIETENFLIKSMTDQELMDAMPVTVKVVAPGIGKLKLDKKKNQKKQKQVQATKGKDDD